MPSIIFIFVLHVMLDIEIIFFPSIVYKKKALKPFSIERSRRDLSGALTRVLYASFCSTRTTFWSTRATFWSTTTTFPFDQNDVLPERRSGRPEGRSGRPERRSVGPERCSGLSERRSGRLERSPRTKIPPRKQKHFFRNYPSPGVPHGAEASTHTCRDMCIPDYL